MSWPRYPDRPARNWKISHEEAWRPHTWLDHEWSGPHIGHLQPVFNLGFDTSWTEHVRRGGRLIGQPVAHPQMPCMLTIGTDWLGMVRVLFCDTSRRADVLSLCEDGRALLVAHPKVRAWAVIPDNRQLHPPQPGEQAVADQLIQGLRMLQINDFASLNPVKDFECHKNKAAQ